MHTFDNILLVDVWNVSSKEPEMLLCVEVQHLRGKEQQKFRFWYPSVTLRTTFPNYMLIMSGKSVQDTDTIDYNIEQFPRFWKSIASHRVLWVLNVVNLSTAPSFVHAASKEICTNWKRFIDSLSALDPSIVFQPAILLAWKSSVAIPLATKLLRKMLIESKHLFLSATSERNCHLLKRFLSNSKKEEFLSLPSCKFVPLTKYVLEVKQLPSLEEYLDDLPLVQYFGSFSSRGTHCDKKCMRPVVPVVLPNKAQQLKFVRHLHSESRHQFYAQQREGVTPSTNPKGILFLNRVVQNCQAKHLDF